MSGKTPERPNVFVQWKGTDVCLDFHCECGYDGHFDGLFCYGLRCGRCGKTWTMPHTFGLVANENPTAEEEAPDAQPTDWPHDGARVTAAGSDYAEVSDEEQP